MVHVSRHYRFLLFFRLLSSFHLPEVSGPSRPPCVCIILLALAEIVSEMIELRKSRSESGHAYGDVGSLILKSYTMFAFMDEE